MEQDHTVIKRYLQNHVDNDKTGDSMFVSFSASLLATLQQAEGQTQHDHTNIHIAVLRNQELQKNHLVLPLAVLHRAFGIVEKRRFISGDCADEYLVWGELVLRTHHIPREILLVKGLYRLLPELDDEEGNKHLGRQLARLRKALFDKTAVTRYDPAKTF